MEAYEKGTVKVVWIKDDPDQIFSKMFDDQKEAEQFAKTLNEENFLIFKLQSQTEMKEFRWQLLPLGK